MKGAGESRDEYKKRLTKGIGDVAKEVGERNKQAEVQANQMIATQQESTDVQEKADAITEEVAGTTHNAHEIARMDKIGLPIQKKMLKQEVSMAKEIKKQADPNTLRGMLSNQMAIAADTGTTEEAIASTEDTASTTKKQLVLEKKDYKEEVKSRKQIKKLATATSLSSPAKFTTGVIGGLGSGIERSFSKGKGKMMKDVGGAMDVGSSPAMVGFEKATDKMATSAKETVLSQTDVADIATKSRSLEPVGGGTGAMEAKPQFGAVGGHSATGAETSKMMIEGKMTVHFDNAMFKDQVANVVATVMKTADFKKAVQVNAFG